MYVCIHTLYVKTYHFLESVGAVPYSSCIVQLPSISASRQSIFSVDLWGSGAGDLGSEAFHSNPGAEGDFFPPRLSRRLAPALSVGCLLSSLSPPSRTYIHTCIEGGWERKGNRSVRKPKGKKIERIENERERGRKGRKEGKESEGQTPSGCHSKHCRCLMWLTGDRVDGDRCG